MPAAQGKLGGGISVERRGEIKTGHPHRAIELRCALTQPIAVDRARFAQMFSNLLGNAVTHGDEDFPIMVEAIDANGHFELSIVNGGKPIPRDAATRLFEPFYRGDPDHRGQGLGLGLYIASRSQMHTGGGSRSNRMKPKPGSPS